MQRQRGFTLVELMISLVLGLLVTGALTGVLLANRQLYRQSESLARLQESARYAFEIMARDLREAGGVACGSNLQPNNLTGISDWWSNWDYRIRGYKGLDALPGSSASSASNRTSIPDPNDHHNDPPQPPHAVIVLSGTANDGVYITEHTHNPLPPDPPYFRVNISAHGIVAGDVLLVCDYERAALVQATSVSGNMISYSGSVPQLDPGGFISKLSAHVWYIGCNDRVGCNDPGGRSLYRLTPGLPREEIAEGVTGLQIEYLTRNGGTLADQYVNADAISDWTSVVAARLTFAFETLEKVGTDIHPIQRNWYTVVSLRNRLP